MSHTSDVLESRRVEQGHCPECSFVAQMTAVSPCAGTADDVEGFTAVKIRTVLPCINMSTSEIT